MEMGEEIYFLNFRISEELKAALDDAATRSGWDRSKQARTMLEAAFGITHKPYIPVPTADGRHFRQPAHGAPGRKSRRRSVA